MSLSTPNSLSAPTAPALSQADHGSLIEFAEGLRLESGVLLRPLQMAYRSYGRLNAAKDNAVLVIHALSGSAALDDWWPQLLGAGLSLDPARDFIVCVNLLGSCYGSSGPLSAAPNSLAQAQATNETYQANFPQVTVRDQVQAQHKLLQHLKLPHWRCIIGPSLGGMIALEWALLYPAQVQSLVVLATSAQHGAQALAHSELQRSAIRLDPDFCDGFYPAQKPPVRGLALARQLAHISYRSPQSLHSRFDRERHDNGRYQICAYLAHQGEKFCARFDANSYIRLTECMNSHDVGRDRGGAIAALKTIQTPTLVIGISSDQLYPIGEQIFLAEHITHAELRIIDSVHGHDGFLLEHESVNQIIGQFLQGVFAVRPADSVETRINNALDTTVQAAVAHATTNETCTGINSVSRERTLLRRMLQRANGAPTSERISQS